MDRPWRIVVPLRLSDAKSRLAMQPALQRRRLVVAMACDVLATAATCSVVGEVVLVADEPGRLAVREAGITDIAMLLDPGTGLNDAIRAGAKGAGGPVCAVLADLPCITPQALAMALAACAGGPAIVCDAEGIGTTLLAAPAAQFLDPHFGPRSRAAHVGAGAREIGDPVPGTFAGVRRDVDSEIDLWDARRLGLGPFTSAVVDGPRESGAGQCPTPPPSRC